VAIGAVFICGDPHGEFSHIIDAVLEWRPAAIVLTGLLRSLRFFT